jgi:hypothetical protein
MEKTLECKRHDNAAVTHFEDWAEGIDWSVRKHKMPKMVNIFDQHSGIAIAIDKPALDVRDRRVTLARVRLRPPQNVPLDGDWAQVSPDANRPIVGGTERVGHKQSLVRAAPIESDEASDQNYGGDSPGDEIGTPDCILDERDGRVVVVGVRNKPECDIPERAINWFS